jgi:hypothetical protein
MRLIGEYWNSATVTALAAIFGSLAGALGSTISAWIAQRHQDRRDLLVKRVSHREQLYSDFIGESAKVMADAIQHTFQDPSRLIPTYALLSRIRLSSSTKVIDSAERLIKAILDTYSEPNLTAEEIQSRAGKRTDKDDNPLRDFSDICRRDLESLSSGF